MSVSAWIVVLVAALGSFALLLNVLACVALVRAADMPRRQKIAQCIFAWVVPIIGAHLVVHFLSESEPQAIPERWIPNDIINGMLDSALGVTVRQVAHYSESVLEKEVLDVVSGHFTSGEAVATHDAGGPSGGGDFGGD